MQMDGFMFSFVILPQSAPLFMTIDFYLTSTGLPAVLHLILRLLRQSAEDRQCRLPTAPRLLPGWHGCVCLQLHLSVKKVINLLKCVCLVCPSGEQNCVYLQRISSGDRDGETSK